MKESIITGIDIGSHAIRIVVGQVSPESGKELHVVAAVEELSEGINKGGIANPDDAARSVTAALEKTERMCGIQIDTAVIGISGTHIIAQGSKGLVAIGKINGEIAKHDLERAIEAARTIATPANYDILHVLPRRCIIDGQISVKDPIGMMGTRLEVDTLVIQGFSSEIRNFTKCMYRTGLEIEDLVFAPLATADAIFSSKQKELGVACLNIGAATTTLIVYEEGEIIHAVVLPFGSDHITNDIAIGLRISIEAAERIKQEYVNFMGLNKKMDIDLSLIAAHEQGYVSLKTLSQIIEARVEEIFDKVVIELKKIGRDGVLPAGIVITGGGSKLGGMLDFAKKYLRLPASYAVVKNIANPIERVADQGFTTASGLALWGLKFHEKGGSQNTFLFNGDATQETRDRVKKWFKSLLP